MKWLNEVCHMALRLLLVDACMLSRLVSQIAHLRPPQKLARHKDRKVVLAWTGVVPGNRVECDCKGLLVGNMAASQGACNTTKCGWL